MKPILELGTPFVTNLFNTQVLNAEMQAVCQFLSSP